MGVPKFDELMLPMLRLASDGLPHRLSDIAPSLAKSLQLSEEDLAETLPSGASRCRNRCYWAKLYLSQAKALNTVSPGTFEITDRGREILSRDLPKISADVLSEFAEFRAFVAEKGTHGAAAAPAIETQRTETPEDAMRTAYESMRAVVVRDIIDTLQAAEPTLLSVVMVKLLLAMGYGDREAANSGIVLDGVHDGGVDGVINKDALGLSRVYIQAKRYKDGNNVGAPAIQQFAGSMQERRADEGVFVTTSDFTKAATDSAERLRSRIALINGQRLAEIMFDLGVGVATQTTYSVKQIDSEFFNQR
jgi:restriction system protein